MSWNSLKIGINNENVLKEIIKDPEVMVRIKDAIVEQASKIAAKAAKDCLERTIEQAARAALNEISEGYRKNEWFSRDRNTIFGSPVLTKQAQEKIRGWSERCVSEECENIMKGIKVEDEIRHALDSKMQEIGGIDVKGMLQKSINSYVDSLAKKLKIGE